MGAAERIRDLAAVAIVVALLLVAPSSSAASPPGAPVITEPSVDGTVTNPADTHMEAGGFSDPDGHGHQCSDWEISGTSPPEVVWEAPCASGLESVHIHLGDGSFVGSHAGRTELNFETDYALRVRFRDTAGEVSAYSVRQFRTSAAGPPGVPAAVPWAVRQAGYEVEIVATGFQLPVNVAMVPEPGADPDDPFLYVTELYGKIKVVSRDGRVSDYATGLLNFNPTGAFPGSGEQGVTGITVDPVSGDVFASMVYEDTASTANPKPHYPKVVRFHSTDGGRTAATQTTIIDMFGESEGQSHQISNLTIGPDGKLYVHNGDGFNTATAQNLSSFRGKVLRMNLDGTAASGNPFYNPSDGITARDYVFAYGLRNPFGGAWRAADSGHYEVENGPSVDRFAQIVSGRNYLWNGTDASMSNFALYNWNPAHAPVNIAFVQPETGSGSGFPVEEMDHAFVTESGPTYATGPQARGKRVVEFAPQGNGTFSGSTPVNLIEYTGTGKASASALAAGPDGLYFTDLYKDLNFSSPIDPGANLLRIRFVNSLRYPRPSTATPLRVPLVPAFSQCSSPTSAHAPPLAFGSCPAPRLESSLVTTSRKGSGYVRLVVQAGNASTPADEADLKVDATLTDVRNASDRSDYAGALILRAALRVTDSVNGPSTAQPATVQDFDFSLPVDCAATSDPAVGSACGVSTTADTLVLGAAREGARTVISVRSLTLLDLGADGSLAAGSDPLGLGCPPTCGSGDEAPFARAGVFAP